MCASYRPKGMHSNSVKCKSANDADTNILCFSFSVAGDVSIINSRILSGQTGCQCEEISCTTIWCVFLHKNITVESF